MNIALIGYGKMGKAIEEIALERGHRITAIFNSQKPFKNDESTRLMLQNTDVAIEFSRPDLAVSHILTAFDLQLPIVVGTTAWQKDGLSIVRGQITEKNASLLHASNFSVGVNILFALNKKLAALMENQADYEVEIEEIHHTQKLDAPSGTAVSLANDIIDNNHRYHLWELKDEQTHFDSNVVPITAIREPEVPGTHFVRYNSEIDTITLAHHAHNRKGFALGSVLAAEFLHDKKGLFTMADVLNI
jgi:4-hydroxy-tetrahydrodipicolinate reductase